MRSLPIPALLAAGAMTLAGCGGDADDDAPAAVPKGTVEMKDIQFSPKALTVAVGDTVTWVNRESVEHNVVAESDPKLKSPLFGEGGKFEFRASKAGTIAYVCTVHPGMEGTLTVE